MKEISIEEKAKAYDEARLKAEQYWECGEWSRETLEYLFPELKESEDEKIRRELLNHLQNAANGRTLVVSTDDYKRWADWLEKYGEQKPVECAKTPMTLDEAITHCEEKSDDTPCGKDHKQLAKWLRELKELKKQKPAWSEEDEYYYGIIQYILNNECVGKKDKEEAINWFKSLRPQPKQEWSEEDYNEIETIACHLDNTNNEGMAEVLRNIRDKYYGIIPQKHWKPSDKQMEALKEACDEHWEPDGLDPLYTLWEQLKKLKEE